MVKHVTGEYSECLPTINSEIHVDSAFPRYIIDGNVYDIPENGVGVFVYDTRIGYSVDLGYVDVYYVGNVVSHFDESE